MSKIGLSISLEKYFIPKEMIRSNRKIKKTELIDWNAVGQRVRELRGFHMTQTEFAHQIGVSQGYLSSIERGEKEVGAAILLAISRECGRSIEWLLTGESSSELTTGK